MKPILFNTDMVKAILDGRKTVTRRVIKPQPSSTAHFVTDNLLPETKEVGASGVYLFSDNTVTHAPYQPGDILYVRETFATSRFESCLHMSSYEYGMWYKADGENKRYKYDWRPSIHMPREAARLFLRVTDVRVERLQDMRLEDCLKEGVTLTIGEKSDLVLAPIAARKRFAEVWDSTIPKHPCKFKRYLYCWKDNPWVWVIEFERISKGEAHNGN